MNNPIIKYKTQFDSIKRVEVLRETENSVFIAGGMKMQCMKEAKRGSFWSYHNSWEEDKAHLVSIEELKVKSAQVSLDSEKIQLEKVKSLKNQEDADDRSAKEGA